LERRVSERTKELARTNADLECRVEERTREREAALAQVHEMQKMESLGQLTGGVAHDFNNLLMAVLGNLSLLKKRVAHESSLLRLVDGAIAGAERGATLTKRMLAFARRQELKPVAVRLDLLVAGLLEMLSRTLGPTVAIEVSISAALPPVRVDPHQLELALLNLAVNGRDAMPDGGRLTVAAHRESEGSRPHTLREGEYVCISVADSGCGMDDATLARATEPFFTTKGVGKGTGLGLSMVHGLAAQSGGAMGINSEPGAGTLVRLWLPVDQEANLHSVHSASDMAVATMHSWRVLVVDDDPLICSSTAAMLEDLGHSVIEAPSGGSALELLRTGTKVDLVVTDQAMPAMTGVELATTIRQNWPWIPVILASGYAEVVEAARAFPRLAKPYQQAELAACITRAFDEANVIPIDFARSG
jgi:nitrogen-specific signal transduction histidine kinase/CheY-like chemotaxis protein